MSAEKKPPFVVQAIYSFKGQNNDELCFKKGDIITVTQVEEGGWWEGTLKDKTGWFPSNYVKEYKADSPPSPNVNVISKSSADLLAQQIANRAVIVNDLIDSEKAHVTELDNLVNKFLVPINCSGALTWEEYGGLVNNITEIVDVHENLLKGLKEWSSVAPEQQRIGRLFITTAVKMKQVHEKYCAAHPRAVLILDKHRDDLSRLMEENGAATPGILVLIAGLSKPFRRLDKYTGILQELKRYMEESHIDRGDVSRSVSVYKDIASSCSAIRRQKELELQILNGGVRGWEGDDLATLGEILFIGSVAVGPELKDRYFVLFPSTLLILSVSNSMTSFVYEGKLPLTGIQVTKLENSDEYKNAFQIKGPMIEEIVAICQTKEDQQTWIEKLTKQMTASKQPTSICISSPSKATAFFTPSNSPTTTTIPKPPPHAVSSIPYIHLTMYLARLVRKKIITRKVLKKLLYQDFMSRYSTESVARRRVHRAEYTMFTAEKATYTWISSATSDSDVAPADAARMSPVPVSDDESLGSVASSCLDYVEKPVFRTTLTLDTQSNKIRYGKELKYVPNFACEDISKMDDDTRMRYDLSDEQNFQRETRQSEPILGRESVPDYDLHSAYTNTGFKSFSINFGGRDWVSGSRCEHKNATAKHNVSTSSSDVTPRQKKYCSSYNISSPVTSNYGHEYTGSDATQRSQIVTRVSNADESSKLSIRSSDSGLADITSPLVNTPTPPAPTNAESDESGNFDQCMCASPYSSTGDDRTYTTERTVETNGQPDEAVTFKSGMYAHWWLKTKIPANALKTPAGSRFSSNTDSIEQSSAVEYH